jgi:hypothetical protein
MALGSEMAIYKRSKEKLAQYGGRKSNEETRNRGISKERK